MAEDEGVGVLELEDNLSDAEKPAEVPPGIYTGEVQEVQLQTSQKGNDFYAIKFNIPQEELPPDVSSEFEDGAVLYWNRQVVPRGKDRRALYNLRKLIEALGLDSNVTTIDPNEWVGQQARLRVVHGTYQGQKRAEIKAIEAAEGQGDEEESAPTPKPTQTRRTGGGRRR